MAEMAAGSYLNSKIQPHCLDLVLLGMALQNMQICKNPINSCVLVGPCLGRDGPDQFLPRYWSHPRGSHGEHFSLYSLDQIAFHAFMTDYGNIDGSNF